MRTFRIISIVGASALLLSASVAFAEDKPTTNAVQRVETSNVRAVAATTTREAAKQAALEKKQTAGTSREKQKVENRTMTTAATNRETVKQATLEKMQVAREEAKKKMETSREEAKVRVEAVRKEAKVRVEAQKEKAAQRLSDIQDKVKKQLAEKMANQFEHLNTTWTDHFLKLLDRYDEILQKMRNRAGVAAGNGSDVTAVDAAIQSAGTVIESARTAVVAQAAKTYALDTSTVTTTAATSTASGQGEILQGLRTVFQNLHKTLFTDLFALRDGPMKDARTAVQSALQALGKVPKVDDDATATTTANQ